MSDQLCAIVVTRSYYTFTREKTEMSLYVEIDEWLADMNFTYGDTVVKNISGPTTECERIYEYLLNVLQIDHLSVLLFVKSVWPLSESNPDEEVKSRLFGGSRRAEEIACEYKWDI